MPANRSELGVLRVATPCARDWDEMTGDARARFCGDCRLTVYDLSELTTDEARALIREKEGRLCVRFFQRADGTVLTRDCPVGVTRRRKLIAGSGAAVSSVAGLAALVLALFTGAPRETKPQPATAISQPPQPAPPPADDTWMEQRRSRLGVREGTHRTGRLWTMGLITVIKSGKP